MHRSSPGISSEDTPESTPMKSQAKRFVDTFALYELCAASSTRSDTLLCTCTSSLCALYSGDRAIQYKDNASWLTSQVRLTSCFEVRVGILLPIGHAVLVGLMQIEAGSPSSMVRGLTTGIIDGYTI